MQNLVITPKLLHKDSNDDVLLSNPRYALPLYIDAITVESWRQAGLDFLLALYQSSNNEQSNLSCLTLATTNYGLTDLLGRAISVDQAWQQYRAIPYQIIEDEFAKSHALLLQDLERFQANAHVANQLVPDLFYSTSYTMINQADHYFFYRKKHEHVPGIMLIEAQRQAVYAHIYSMTQYVRGEVTIGLGKLNSVFYCYVDLMHPVELIVDELRDKRESRAKRTYRVSFFQRSKLVAIIDTEVSIIEMDQFKHVRNLFLYEKGGYCYRPIRKDEIQCALFDSRNSEYLVDCIAVSRDGCTTTCNNLAIDQISKITIKSDDVTFVSNIELENRSPEKVSWKFSNLNHDQLINMGEIIKREFILQDK